MLESLLDEIPGLGDTRRQTLLDNYGSVAALKKAEENELAQVPGIGPRLAKTIYEYLQKDSYIALNTETGEILDT